MELQEKIKMYLENSPQIDSLPNPDLLGYMFADGFVCAKCAQRIMMRGCWGYLEPSVVVWSDSGAHGCCLGCDYPGIREKCNHDKAADLARKMHPGCEIVSVTYV